LSELSILISVDGVEFPRWDAAFRENLSKTPQGAHVDIQHAGGGTGSLGVRSGGQVRVRAKSDAADVDWTKVISVVLSALSLAVGSAQLALKLSEPHPVAAPDKQAIVCEIVGTKGRATLRLETSGQVPEEILRQCLQQSGTPKRIQARPRYSSPHH
jgi:hypothetical protein